MGSNNSDNQANAAGLIVPVVLGGLAFMTGLPFYAWPLVLLPIGGTIWALRQVAKGLDDADR